MKAEEFRIGNLINVRCIAKELCGIDDFEPQPLNVHNLTGIINGNDDFTYEPISLTEEWLLKLGFEKANDIDSFYKIDLNNNTKMFYSFKWDLCEISISGLGFNMKHIKSVHQLQNIFHSLTGTELTLNQ